MDRKLTWCRRCGGAVWDPPFSSGPHRCPPAHTVRCPVLDDRTVTIYTEGPRERAAEQFAAEELWELGRNGGSEEIEVIVDEAETFYMCTEVVWVAEQALEEQCTHKPCRADLSTACPVFQAPRGVLCSGGCPAAPPGFHTVGSLEPGQPLLDDVEAEQGETP